MSRRSLVALVGAPLLSSAIACAPPPTNVPGEELRIQPKEQLRASGDADADGVPDLHDQCPVEPGIKPGGCPDRDGDLFPDIRDNCPDQPGHEPDGCPIPDTDGDGLLDPNDKCPNEPESYNSIGDDDGCPDEVPKDLARYLGVVKGIQFNTDTAKFKRRSKGTLTKIAAVLKRHPEIRVEIAAHTDHVGSDEYNTALSRLRAEAVIDELVARGVDRARLSARAAGKSQPISEDPEV
ncbi:MAG: OmpA family protein, partial [Myxococcales bacterium]|nr:OmpA family protein [Myxococcales bacterium]